MVSLGDMWKPVLVWLVLWVVTCMGMVLFFRSDSQTLVDNKEQVIPEGFGPDSKNFM